MFSDILTSLLKERRLNALTLAKEIGVPKSVVYEWKNGVREPSVENMVRLAEYFGVSMDYLTDRASTSPEEEELLVLLRAAKNISSADYTAMVEGFKSNLDAYLQFNREDTDDAKRN